MNRNHIKIAVGIVISAIGLYLVFKHVEWPKLFEALQEARYEYIAAAVAVYMGSMFVRALRLKFLLSPIKNIPFIRLFPPIIVGYAANNLFPLRAGEIVRAWFTGQREDISKSASFAAIVVERIFDGLTIALLLSVCLFTVEFDAATSLNALRFTLWLGGAAFATAFLGCLMLVFMREQTLWLIERIFQFETIGISEKLLPIVHKLVNGLEVLRSPKDSFVVLLLSFTVWGCEALMYLLVGMSVGIENVEPLNYLVVLCIINLVIMIPAAPGFAGTFEKAGVETLKLFAVPVNTAVAFTLLLHLAQYLPSTLTGMFYMWRDNISLSRAQSEGEETPAETEVLSTSSQG